ncbi:formate dehydrogenase subunit delta [Poseidonocella sp. HB161398]|uniref:formate dehydrogenase subunit delta n=1 Tax=Poseidonocella sp. HB161398 TaxID=2320855 RepID=UPI001108F586|nr:formate dehydrogenase subunit delta [Poseidonocella sp. HB161398]
MSPEKMVMMANQIATFFKTQPGSDQAARVADHLNDFWEPRMRSQLARHMEAGGEGLEPLVKEAFAQVRVPAE